MSFASVNHRNIRSTCVSQDVKLKNSAKNEDKHAFHYLARPLGGVGKKALTMRSPKGFDATSGIAMRSSRLQYAN